MAREPLVIITAVAFGELGRAQLFASEALRDSFEGRSFAFCLSYCRLVAVNHQEYVQVGATDLIDYKAGIADRAHRVSIYV